MKQFDDVDRPGGKLPTFDQEQQWLQLFFDLPFVGMAVTSPESRRWLRVNDELCRMLGYPREELLRKTWVELTHPQDLDVDLQNFARVRAGEIDAYRLRKRFIRADGGTVHAAIDVRCTRLPDGRVDLFVATIQDLTDEVEAAAALAHSRDMYAMLSGTNEAALHARTDRELLKAVCATAVQAGGFSLAVAHMHDEQRELQMVATEIVAGPGRPALPGHLAEAREHCLAVMRTGETLAHVTEGPLPAGGKGRDTPPSTIGSWASAPLRRGARVVGALTLFSRERSFFSPDVLALLNEVGNTLWHALDALALKRAQIEADRLRRDAELRLAAIIDASVSPIWLADLEGHFLLVNRSCADLLHAAPQEVAGRHRAELMPAAAVAEHRANDEQVLASMRPQLFEEHIDAPDGRRTFLSTKFPVRDADGRVFAVGGLATDVTELRETTGALRAANARWASLIDNSPEAIFDLDRKGCVQSIWNRAAEQLTGVPALEAIGKPLPIDADDGGMGRRLLWRTLRGRAIHGEPATCRLRGGDIVHVNASMAPIHGPGGRIEGALVIVVNVTERVRTQEALASSERMYRLLFEHNPAPMWVYDLGDRRIRAVNDAAVHAYGYRREEFLGLRIDDLRPPEDVPALLEQISATHDAIQHSGPWRHRLHDGTLVDVMIDSHFLEFEGRPARLVMSTNVTERLRAESALQASELRLRSLNAELEDRIGERTRELVEAKDRAVAADRLKSVFLATVSHELRTPLNSIIGFSDVLLTGLSGPLSAEQEKHVTIVNAAGRQLLGLITDFLDISRIEAGALTLSIEPLCLSTTLQDDVEGYRKSAADKGLQFRWLSCGTATRVMADARRVRQVVANLVSNAIKFTDAGTVTLRSESWGDGVRLSVEDTGIGIAAGDLPVVFEPFRRLETAGQENRDGTGLGLSIARKLTEAMGGEIGATSEPGKGSCFWFTLPRAG